MQVINNVVNFVTRAIQAIVNFSKSAYKIQTILLKKRLNFYDIFFKSHIFFDVSNLDFFNHPVLITNFQKTFFWSYIAVRKK